VILEETSLLQVLEVEHGWLNKSNVLPAHVANRT